MRIYFLFLFIIKCIFPLQAQTDTLVYDFTDSIHIDAQPEFPGGESAFSQFIRNRIIYPEDAVRAGLQGKVYLSFIIEKDGSLSSIKTLQGKYFSASCEKEAIDVVSRSPKWKPGLKNGEPVRIRKRTVLFFSLAKPASIAITTTDKRVKNISDVHDTTVFTVVRTMPEFRSANGSLYTFIQKNIVYPSDAKEKNITGFVVVSFIVEKNGTISNVCVVPDKGLSPSCNQAAIDLVSGFPAWIPGDHKGKYARVIQMVKIIFE